MRPQHGAFSHSGAQAEYQRVLRPPLRLAASATTVVSIIENGAGSVEVSARPGLAEDALDLGERLQDPVLRLQQAAAPRRPRCPGSVVGM